MLKPVPLTAPLAARVVNAPDAGVVAPTVVESTVLPVIVAETRVLPVSVWELSKVARSAANAVRDTIALPDREMAALALLDLETLRVNDPVDAV